LLPLAAAHQKSRFDFFRQIVVGWQVRDDPDVKFFAQLALRGQVDVRHVRDHEGWCKVQPFVDLPQARLQKQYIASVGRRCPRCEWRQQHCFVVLGNPESQAMFLVANKPAALAGFDCARPNGGMLR